MTIDPRVGFWFSILAAVNSAWIAAAAQFTDLFGAQNGKMIIGAVVIINVAVSAVNAILHGIPAQSNLSPDQAAKFALGPKAVPVILLALILGTLAFPGGAMAQGQIQQDIKAKLAGFNQQIAGRSTAPASPATIDTIMSAISKPFSDLANFVTSDSTGAATLATQIPNLQDTNGKACWTKMQNAGAVFEAHPVPLTLKAMTDFEALRLLQMTANDLCSYAPCTVVFSDGANLATAVASAVGGALASNAVPSLTQLCARIPQLSPMLPPAVTGIAPTPPPASGLILAPAAQGNPSLGAGPAIPAAK